MRYKLQWFDAKHGNCWQDSWDYPQFFCDPIAAGRAVERAERHSCTGLRYRAAKVRV